MAVRAAAESMESEVTLFCSRYGVASAPCRSGRVTEVRTLYIAGTRILGINNESLESNVLGRPVI